MTQLNIFTDGASRGNPGDSGAGILIYKNSSILEEISYYLGKKTNNQAEYLAVIIAFHKILKLKNNGELENIEKINLFSDSQFLIRQLKGEYKVKSSNILELFKILNNLIDLINIKINYTWIPREENSKADSLANKGIDEKNNKSNNYNNNNIFNMDLIISIIKNNKIINYNNNYNNNNNNNNNDNNDKRKYNNDEKYIDNKKLTNLILEKSFFGKINCFKLQLNSNYEIYFHLGLNKNNNWEWVKVKMNDIEIGEIINLLNKNEDKCSFFHSYDNSKTQIWCSKSSNKFSIKINNISKNFSIGEFTILKILLENCIIKRNFS